MQTLSTRKIVVAGAMSAVAILLGVTRWGFLPWFAGASLTIMHVPVIIAAVLEGPVVGLIVGAIFGVFSLIQAAMPNVQLDPIFLNPLVSIFPRLFIGPAAWLIHHALKRYPLPALIAAGVGGSLTNTVLVLGMIGLLGLYPWAILFPIVWANGLPEAGAAAVITVAVVSAWLGLDNRRAGADL